MKEITIKLPEIEDIEFTIECLDEFEHPQDCFALDDETQHEVVNRILTDLDNGNEWAWCCVRVIGKYKSFKAETTLGACSYESEEHFRNDDYYADMREEIYNDIISQMEALVID